MSRTRTASWLTSVEAAALRTGSTAATRVCSASCGHTVADQATQSSAPEAPQPPESCPATAVGWSVTGAASACSTTTCHPHQV